LNYRRISVLIESLKNRELKNMSDEPLVAPKEQENTNAWRGG